MEGGQEDVVKKEKDASESVNHEDNTHEKSSTDTDQENNERANREFMEILEIFDKMKRDFEEIERDYAIHASKNKIKPLLPSSSGKVNPDFSAYMETKYEPCKEEDFNYEDPEDDYLDDDDDLENEDHKD